MRNAPRLGHPEVEGGDRVFLQKGHDQPCGVVILHDAICSQARPAKEPREVSGEKLVMSR